jgi:hypothetical protein
MAALSLRKRKRPPMACWHLELIMLRTARWWWILHG